MTYYKVPQAWDQEPRPKQTKTGYYIFDGIWIGGELYTRRELEKRGAFGALKRFEKVEISKKQVYWFFGARRAVEVIP